jgi:predicted transcriptional regulator
MDYFAPLKSELKLKIMLSLLKGEKKIADLTNEIQTRETTILHVLKEFETSNLTTKVGSSYKLTSTGFINACICQEFFKTTDAIEGLKDFWLPHDVTPIPSYFLLKLGALKDSSIVKTESSELGKVHETFLNVLLTSKRIRGTSPIFHNDFVKTFRQLLSQSDTTVELILTSAVLEKTLSSAESDLLKKYASESRLKIFLKDDLKIALTVTDNSFSLGLFSLNGEYDYNMDLISFNPEAIEWGDALFQDCLKGSKRIILNNIG